MMRSVVLPLLIIGAGVAVVFMYTMPGYENVKRLQSRESQVQSTLNDASKIVSLIEDLKIQYDSFPVETRNKLQTMLPDVVEPIDVIVEVNSVAGGSVSLSNASAEKLTPDTSLSEAFFVEPSAYNTIGASYSLSSDYPQLVEFVRRLEFGLRLTDINSMSFSVDNETGFMGASVETSTYWLNE